MQITHCPQCETAFKVSPQQLALAKGWVRCGRCAHVFEAHLYFESSVPITAEESLVTPAVSATELPAPELFRTGVTQSSSVISDETNPDQSGKATTTFSHIATLVGVGLTPTSSSNFAPVAQVAEHSLRKREGGFSINPCGSMPG